MNGIVVVPASEDDLPFLVEMIELSLLSLPDIALKQPSEVRGMALFEAAQLKSESSPNFIAWKDKTQAGAAWLKFDGEPFTPYYSLGLAVAPDFQRSGIGSSLLKFCLEYCRSNKAAAVTLKVHPSNKAALRIYQQAGFEEIALEMRKRF